MKQSQMKCTGTKLGIQCDRNAYSRGLCLMYYKRVWRHGSVESLKKVPNVGFSLEDRLHFHGWVVKDSGCWEFSGRRDSAGYGRLDFDNRDASAHRTAYQIWVGPIPAEMIVMHSCDNPPCINPAHLSVGTHQDNMDDMTGKGRASRRSGESNPFSKLTESQAIEVLAYTDRPLKYFAEKFNVSISTISKIRTGKNWSYLSEDRAANSRR